MECWLKFKEPREDIERAKEKSNEVDCFIGFLFGLFSVFSWL
jgi:hypothetical protein